MIEHKILLVDGHRIVSYGVAAMLELAGGFVVVGEVQTASEALEILASQTVDLVLTEIDLMTSRIDATVTSRELSAAGSVVEELSAETSSQSSSDSLEPGAEPLAEHLDSPAPVQASTDDSPARHPSAKRSPIGHLADDLASDGVQLTREIKTRYPAVRVLALTTHTDEEAILSMIQAGAEGYVTKSVTPDELIQAVRLVAQGQVLYPGAIKRLIIQELGGPTARQDEMITKREMQILRLVAAGATSREMAIELSLSSKTIDNHRGRLLEKLGARNKAEAVAHAIRHGILEPEATVRRWHGRRPAAEARFPTDAHSAKVLGGASAASGASTLPADAQPTLPGRSGIDCADAFPARTAAGEFDAARGTDATATAGDYEAARGSKAASTFETAPDAFREVHTTDTAATSEGEPNIVT